MEVGERLTITGPSVGGAQFKPITTGAGEGSVGVSTDLITIVSSQGTFIDVVTESPSWREARSTTASEGSLIVHTDLLTAAIIGRTLIYICKKHAKCLQSSSQVIVGCTLGCIPVCTHPTVQGRNGLPQHYL